MQYILDCVTTVLTAVLCFLMLFRKYEINKKYLPIRIIGAVGIVALKIGVGFLQIPVFNFISSCIMIIFIIHSIYDCKIVTSLIYSLLFLMIAFVSDTLGVLIVSSFYNHTITETIGAIDLIWYYHIWNWLLQIFISRIVALLIQKKDNIRVKWHEMIFYLLLLLFEIVFFATVSTAVEDYISGHFLIFTMTGFMILDICVMYILHKISLLRETEQKVNLMQQQEKLQLQMYQELRKKYNATHEIAHDINRHISALKSLVESHPNMQAEYYLSDLTKDTERLRPVIKNQNAMLEIILNTFSSRCEKENIVLEMNVEDFPMKFISDMDITTIFSNLFDNAIDACLELSKSQRKICFILKMQMGLIVIRITNPCNITETKEFVFFHSTKENHSGIGLSNVKRTVEKYDGILSVKKANNMFCVSITFSDNT